MIIGVPKEVKDHESRVGITPAGVKALVDAGHKVLVETNAAAASPRSPMTNTRPSAAEIVGGCRGNVLGQCRYGRQGEGARREGVRLLPRRGLVLFTYLHLAPIKGLTDALLSKKVTGIAYETVKDAAGTLPLLTPMSRGRRTAFGAGWRGVSREGARRARGPAGRRSGSFAGQRLHHHGGGIVGTNAAPRSRWAWARGSRSSISISIASASLTTSSPVTSTRWPRTPTTSSALSLKRPIWLLEEFSSPVPLHPRSSPKRWSPK